MQLAIFMRKQNLAVGPPELVFDSSPSRALTSVNVRRDDKDVFDVLQAYWSIRKKRQLTHWETFSLVLADAVAVHDREFRALGLLARKDP